MIKNFHRNLKGKIIQNFVFLFFVAFAVQLQGQQLSITNDPETGYFEPLNKIEVNVDTKAFISVMDGMGRKYVTDIPVNGTTTFTIGGALGSHTILVTDKKGRLLDTKDFKVDTKTSLTDKGGKYKDMLDMLYYTMNTGHANLPIRYNGETRMSFAGWFQDHVHVFKAMKYFYPDATSGIDIYADGQKENGMIYDNHYQKYEHWKMWLNRFGPEFVSVPGPKDQYSSFFVRIPVENMSEFTFLESVYYAWKATGDDEWMKTRVDNCIKAIEYATSDPYRWSEKHQLLKRGYTIDIWDFQPPKEVEALGGDEMMADPEVTNYNILYADNIGIAVGCEYTAEMLEYAGRFEEANRIRAIGDGIRERTDKLCWNGEFYMHHVPEDPDYYPDFGKTDGSKQVTISNGYALNRRISHDKAVAIINTYQRIADEMPETSAGEWYMCYPPFDKGWGHREKWEYMDGGVSSIVAGEVAHGAFQHGYEDYGVQILDKMIEWSTWTDNRLMCIYRGQMPDEPQRNFTTLSLKSVANADIHGDGAKDVPGFTSEGDNDMREFPTGKQVFEKIPFDVVAPAENGRKACMILADLPQYDLQKVLPVNKKAKSIYLLHAQSGSRSTGSVVVNYKDGTSVTKYINKGDNVNNWWYPQQPSYGRPGYPYHLAWEGKNAHSNSIGAFLWGFNNPHPEKEIMNLEFNGVKGGTKWIVLGTTISDYPVFFMPERESFGAPDNWGAAAVVYALMEGLAGIKDDGIAFNQATIAPRWSAAGVDEVSTTLKYEASGGYVTYNYAMQDNAIDITFTGSSDITELKVLLPQNKKAKKVILDEKEQYFSNETIENSDYVVKTVSEPGVHRLRIVL